MEYHNRIIFIGCINLFVSMFLMNYKLKSATLQHEKRQRGGSKRRHLGPAF